LSAIYLIDDTANNGRSAMHRASPKTKMFSAGVALGAMIFSTSLSALVSQFFLAIVFQAASRLPVRRLLIWAAYPAFFADIFAISQAQYSLALSAQTLLRAIDAALLMLLLVNTTPFTRVIATVGKISRTLSNLAFLSYRFFFLFIEEFERRLTAIRVRGGLHGSIWSKVRNAASLIGLLFVSFIESGEEVYDAIKTRGYQGRFSAEAATAGGITRNDGAPLLLAALAVAIFLLGSVCGLP
jgi:cobalt/nickel transport system permease protein